LAERHDDAGLGYVEEQSKTLAGSPMSGPSRASVPPFGALDARTYFGPDGGLIESSRRV